MTMSARVPSSPSRRRRAPGPKLLLAAAALRLLALGLAGACLSSIDSLVDRLVAPALADDGNGHGNGKGDGNGGGNGNGSGGGNGNGGGNGGGNGNGQEGSNGNDHGNGDGQGNGNGDGQGNGNGNGQGNGTGEDGGGAGLAASGGSAAAGGANSGHEGRHGFEPGEVVVLGDRPETLARVQSLGFRLIEARPLSALGLSVLKLGTPAGLDSRQAVALLHARLPGVSADVNSVYRSYETEAAQVVSLPAPDYARRMIRWSGGEGCGLGLRIGMIDSGLAAGLPVFAPTAMASSRPAPAAGS
jgi:hypothetical protein